MKALLTQEGILHYIDNYDVDKKDNPLVYYCYPEGETSIDVEYESYEPIRANKALWVEKEGYYLHTLVEYVKKVRIPSDLQIQHITITDHIVIHLLNQDFDRYAYMLQDCFYLFHQKRIQLRLDDWDDVNEFSFEVLN